MKKIIRQSGFKRAHCSPQKTVARRLEQPITVMETTGENTPETDTQDACGRTYSAASVSSAVQQTTGIKCLWSSDVISDVVELLCNGMIVGWFDGSSELGPRALGQRSILCDPRLPEGKAKLNRQVKMREAFRPFAPRSVEEVAEWFEGNRDPRAHAARFGFPTKQGGVVPSVVRATTLDGFKRSGM